MKNLLHDNKYYREIRKNENEKLIEVKKEYKLLIDKLFKKKYITTIEKTKLNINNCNFARIYGLPKIHKTDIPLRPIVDLINAPTEKLSKLITPTLDHLNNNNQFDIKNSLELKTFLGKLKLEPDDILISLDVESLFTNIPLQDVYYILQNNWTLIEPYTNIKCKNTYLEIIKFICNNNYIKYNSKLYRQLKGTPMGNSLSVNLAGILLNSIITEALNKINNKPKLIKKYIDDLFLIIKKQDVNNILTVFNNENKNIKFTCEEEKNNSLSFLDITITKHNNIELKTKWYEKDIKKLQFINFYSNHPFYQKKNAAYNLINKAINLTDTIFLEELKVKLFNKLKLNLFPIAIIKKLWYSAIVNIKQPNEHQEITVRKKYYSLTYVKNLTEKIKKTFQDFDCNEIVFGLKPNKKIKSHFFTKLKDKIDPLKNQNLVYEIPCQCKQVYIGETSQQLCNRLDQHSYDVRRKNNKTALAQHAAETNHKVLFDEVRIINKEKHTYKRRYLEAAHISFKKNTINYKTDKKDLNKKYAGIYNLMSNHFVEN